MTVFGIALLLRLGFMVVNGAIGGSTAFVIEDTAQFLSEARAFAEHGTLTGFASDGTPVFNPQIMPLISSAFIILGVDEVEKAWRLVLLNHLIDAVTCVLIAMTAGLVSKKYVLPAGLIAAANLTMIQVANLALSDTICLLFYALLLYSVIAALVTDRDRFSMWRTVLLCAVAITGAVYTRYVSVYLSVGLLSLAATLVIWRYRQLALRRASALALAGLVAFMASQPIAMRNEVAFGEYEFSIQSGTHLLFWVVPLARDLSGTQSFIEAQSEAEARMTALIGPRPWTMSSFELSDTMQNVGTEMFWETGVSALTLGWAIGSALNLGTPIVSINPMLRDLPHESFYETPGDSIVTKLFAYFTAAENQPYAAIVLGCGVGMLLWMAICAVGIWSSARVDLLAVLLLMGWFAGVLAVTGPIVSPKYRLPLEPGFCILVGAALQMFFQKTKELKNGVC